MEKEAHFLQSSEYSTQMGLLFDKQKEIPNRAIQTLLNQGTLRTSKTTSLIEPISLILLNILSKKNKKITDIDFVDEKISFVDTPIITSAKIGNSIGYMIFDWTLAYLIIDGILGGINGLSIEKKRSSYSEIDKNLLFPVFSSIWEALGRHFSFSFNEVQITSTISHTDLKDFVFSLTTPQTTGFLTLTLPSFIFKDSSPCQKNPISLLKKLNLSASVILKDFPIPLSKVLSLKKGDFINLNILNSPKLPAQLKTKKTTLLELSIPVKEDENAF